MLKSSAGVSHFEKAAGRMPNSMSKYTLCGCLGFLGGLSILENIGPLKLRAGSSSGTVAGLSSISGSSYQAAMKHALLLLALPAHATQISTEVSHTGQPESRWMRSEAA